MCTFRIFSSFSFNFNAFRGLQTSLAAKRTILASVVELRGTVDDVALESFS